MANATNDDYLVSKGYAWYVFALLFGLMLFDFMDRTLLASIYPFLQRDWGLSDAQCGVLSASVNWSITLFAVPVAVLADRWSRKKTVGLMSVVWSLATIACAFTHNFGQLMAARFVLGAGEAGYVPAGNSLISALFPARLRAALIGIFIGASSVGGAAGLVLGGWIATNYGWRHAFGLVGLPGLVLAFLFFFIRDYKTVDLTITAQARDGSSIKRKMNFREIGRELVGKPSLLFLYSGQLFGLMFIGAMGAWLPSYFIRLHGLSVPQASARAGVIVVVCIIGNYVGGLIADRLFTSGIKNARPVVAAIAQLVNVVIFMSAFIFLTGSTQFYLLVLGGVFLASYNGPVYSSVTELVHPGLRSTSISLMTLIQNILGFALGPIIVGLLSDRSGIHSAMIAISCAPALSMACYILASCYYTKDLAQVEPIELRLENNHESGTIIPQEAA